MRTGLVVGSSTVTAGLVLLASDGVVWSFRIAAAVLVVALVALGQRWRMPVVAGAGLVGLVVVVGAGGASTSGSLGLVAWALPTWAVVLVVARTTTADHPTPRDTATRARVVTGEVVAVVASLALVVPAAARASGAPGWAAAGGIIVVALVAGAAGRARTREG